MATWTKQKDGKWKSDDGSFADASKARELEAKYSTNTKQPGFRASDLWNKPSMLPEPVNQFLWGFNEPLAAIMDTVTAPFQKGGASFRRNTVGPEPKNTAGRVLRAGGRMGFDTAAILAPQLRAAQVGALAAPLAPEAGAITRTAKTILDQTRAAPSRVAATEALAGVGGGVGSQAASETFPNSQVAPVLGGLAGAASLGAMGARSLRQTVSPIKPAGTAPNPNAGRIRKQAAELPENTAPTVVSPERPSVALQKEIADAAHDLLTAGGVPRDKNLKLYEQVADLLESGRLSSKSVKGVLDLRGITPTQLANQLYGQNISQAAKELQVLSHLSQRLSKLAEPESFDNRSTIQKLDDIRRGLLVSQLATAVRNATVGVGRSIFDTFERGLEYGLQAMRGQVNPENPVKTPSQIWSGLARFMAPKDNFDVARKALEIRPSMYDRLMRQYSADLALGTNTLGTMQKAVYALNVFNRAQDQLLRSAVFADSLERRLALSGADMRKLLASGQAGTIPRETLEHAVNDALEFTFSDDVRTASGRAFVNFVEQFRPLTTMALPFPRFLANSLRFMTEASPFGPLWLLNKAERQAMKAGSNRIASRFLLGSAMTYAGYSIRDSEFAGEKWYEIKSGDRTIDTRPYYPVAAYLFVGDLVKRANDGTLFGMTAKDLLQGFSGAQVRGGTGLYIVDGLVAEVSGDAAAGHKAWNVAKRLAGEYAAGYALPFQQLKDAYAQFDEKDRILRDTSEAPFTGPIVTKFPAASQDLPEVESPTQAGPILRQDPLLRQLTGVTFNQAKNPAQKEFDRLGYKRVEIFRNTGIPEADRLIQSKLGPLVEEYISRVVESPLYQSIGALQNGGGPPAQRYMLDQYMGYLREIARAQATQDNPALMARVRYVSGVDKDLRILIERLLGSGPDHEAARAQASNN